MSEESTPGDWAWRPQAEVCAAEPPAASPFLSPPLPSARPSTAGSDTRRGGRPTPPPSPPTVVALSRDFAGLLEEFELFTSRGAAAGPREPPAHAQRLPALRDRPPRPSTSAPATARRAYSFTGHGRVFPAVSPRRSASRQQAQGEEPTAATEAQAENRQESVTPVSRDGRICVVVRKRPLREEDTGGDCVHVNAPNVHIAVRKRRVDLTSYDDVNDFVFDDAFDENKTNVHLFDACGKDLLTTVMEGGSASCFAYGQTGSGKTHTMIGSDFEKGLYFLAAAELFKRLSPEHEVYASLYEIYCNSLFDLLNSRAPVVAREDSNRRVNICGLTWQPVDSVMSLWTLIGNGAEQRRTGSTSANERSSRSHAVLTIQVKRKDNALFCGTLNFVDLAGSERAGDTAQTDKQTRLEGADINKSLLALKECIRALDEKKRHIPFRGSKLTEILRGSFTTNSRTLMIANISASESNYEHTVNTLRYAFRVQGLSIETVAPSRARNAPRPAPRPSGDFAAPDADERTARPKGPARSFSTAAGNQRGANGSGAPPAALSVSPGSPATPRDAAVKYLRALPHDRRVAMLPHDAKECKTPNVRKAPLMRSAEEQGTEVREEQQPRSGLGNQTKQLLIERNELIQKLREENQALRDRVALLETKTSKSYCPMCRHKLDST